MPKTTIRFHSDAIKESETAQDWYAGRSVFAAHAFLRELTHAIYQVRHNPTTWPEFTQGTRKYVLPRFPFTLVYRIHPKNTVVIIAVMHQKRRPGYWRSRAVTP